MQLTREQVIAYRVAAQGLHREASAVGELGVLDLGVQEAMGHPASVIFAARLDDAAAAAPDAVEVGPGHDLALAWTMRGAPHVHRRADLDRIAKVLWPLSEADATARLNETGPSIAKKGVAALEQFRIAVTELRASVPAPTAKGAVSTEVSKRIPAAMLRECRPCGTSHISDSAMRAAAPAAGLELEPGTSPPVLLRRRGAKQPTKADPKAVALFALDYLRFLGPAGDAEFAGFLEARRADIKGIWPADLAEVSVDGRTAWLASENLDALQDAREPAIVRLLGPFDPYLQARDRTLIVPDKAVHKALWPVLGRPGAVFVEGEIAGTWRTKASGRKLAITVEAFGPLSKSSWTAIDDEATRVAVVRGCSEVAVTRKK
ncbi:MAG: winged helix DNA-binding domain-containing protein [Actinomycetota bacterium]|nr:winged helix DNA-binding domain-containing protein [Actinomycetota bacterium]